MQINISNNTIYKVDLGIKSFLGFVKDFWQKIGSNETTMIREDAINGIMQDGQSNIPLISEQYKRYKANWMNRFTTGAPTMSSIKGKKDLYFKNPKNRTNVGPKISPYNGVSIESNDVSKVTMRLTGQTLRGLKNNINPHQDNLGVTISYNQNDAGKIFGNQDRGRDIVGLRKENQDEIFNQILKVVDENIKNEFEKDFTINIS